MGIYNLRMSSAKGRSVVDKFNYIVREEEYSYLKDDKYDDFIYSEHMNLPSFAQNDPSLFWNIVEGYERENANLFREIEFSIPYELSDEERIEVATEFAKKIFGNEYVYSLAIHNKKSSLDNVDNVHCHIIFSERRLDNIERDKKQFFKNYKSKEPHLGGCKKEDWSRKAKLYEIREEWEKTANSYLKKYDTSISCKSLENQRIQAIMEGNFLKAEMLDRRAVDIDLQLYKYCYNSEVRENSIKYFESAKRVKEYKEKLYKLRCKNFDEENEKARQRFLNNEREEIDFSRFDIQENADNIAEKVEENIKYNEEKLVEVRDTVNNFISNNVEVIENNKKIEELAFVTDIELEEKALNILTNNAYNDKINRLYEIESLYDKVLNKDIFEFKEEKEELEKYFANLRNDKLFNMNLRKVKEELVKDNLAEIEKLKERNSKLDISNIELEDNVESKKVLKENLDTLFSDYQKLEDIRNDIYKFKTFEFNKEKVLFDIYRNMNREDLILKKKELEDWKQQLNKTTDENVKEELEKKINAREGGFIKFNLNNNIDTQIDFILEEKENRYKELKDKEIKLINKIKFTNDFISNHSDILNDELDDKHKQIIEDFNYENIFKTSIDISILIDSKESRIKQLNTINEEEINSRAYNILTKNEYSKNLRELEEINIVYDKSIDKEKFIFKERKAQLEEYFNNLNKNEYFQNKLRNMKENIREKYKLEKEQLATELNELRNSQYRNLYKENTDESFILSKNIMRETYSSLTELYDKSKEIDKRVKNYKLKMLDEEEIVLDIYRKLDREDVIEKYRELKEWKEQLNKTTDEKIKEELQSNINAREGGLAKFNIDNNVTSQIEDILTERRKVYKELRKEQDDIKGRIKYSKELIDKLKDKQKDEIVYENNLLKKEFEEVKKIDEREDISSIEKFYHKLIYNCKVEDNETLMQNKVNVSLEKSDNKFNFVLNQEEKTELRKIIVEKINKLVEENNTLQEDTNLKILDDDKELMRYILDKKTDNEYSKTLATIQLYKNEIVKNKDVAQYKLMLEVTEKTLNNILKNNVVTDDEKNSVRANIRSNSISKITQLYKNKKEIRILYSSLKELNTAKYSSLSSLLQRNNTKDDNMPNTYNYNKKLYVLGVDKIVIEEEDVVEKERRRILWEHSR